MTDTTKLELRRMAEQFRTRAGLIEGKHGKVVWVQAINVMEAFQQCAEEIEAFVAEKAGETELQNLQNTETAVNAS